MKDLIYNVAGSSFAGSFLVTGQKNLLIDTGMAYAAPIMINKIKDILGTKPLDAVFLTHSHYDHTAGIPYIRNVWPEVVVYASGYAKYILSKSTALSLMRKLSQQAAESADVSWFGNYSDEAMGVDVAVADEEIVVLGNHKIQVIGSPGHTQCSISFLLDQELLFASETVGVLSGGGTYLPNYLVGYKDTINTINRCRQLLAKRVVISHYGLVDPAEYPDLWGYLIEKTLESKGFILNLMRRGLSEEEQLLAMSLEYRDEELKKGQPDEAFFLNARSILRTLQREFG